MNGVSILTNQVTANVDMKPGQRPWKHSMGNVVGHESQVRIMVRTKSSSKGLRELKIEKAIDLPPKSCELYLGYWGFTDEKQEEPEEPKESNRKADESDLFEEVDEKVTSKKRTSSKGKAKATT